MSGVYPRLCLLVMQRTIGLRRSNWARAYDYNLQPRAVVAVEAGWQVK